MHLGPDNLIIRVMTVITLLSNQVNLMNMHVSVFPSASHVSPAALLQPNMQIWSNIITIIAWHHFDHIWSALIRTLIKLISESFKLCFRPAAPTIGWWLIDPEWTSSQCDYQCISWDQLMKILLKKTIIGIGISNLPLGWRTYWPRMTMGGTSDVSSPQPHLQTVEHNCATHTRAHTHTHTHTCALAQTYTHTHTLYCFAVVTMGTC